MAYKESDFIKVKAQYFVQGMFVSGEVYMMNGKYPMLLCTNCIITKEILDHLHSIQETWGYLYVEKDYADAIIQQYEYFSNNESYILNDYTNNKEQMKEVFDDVFASGALSTTKAQKLAKQVQTMVDFVDTSLLVQCTTYLRDSSEYLYQHSLSVSVINGLMAKWLKLSKEDSEKLVFIGLLHDMGKIKIPAKILDKPGKLTYEEFEVIKLHPIFSEELLVEAGIVDPDILTAVRGHHEKMTGSGYPDGKKMGEIPLFTRITTISDIYDAMVAKRTYKDAASPLEVLDIFSKERYSDLDIELVELFLQMMARELTGKKAILSDGSIVTIKYINEKQFLEPLVEGNGKIFNLDRKLRCVAICD